MVESDTLKQIEQGRKLRKEWSPFGLYIRNRQNDFTDGQQYNFNDDFLWNLPARFSFSLSSQIGNDDDLLRRPLLRIRTHHSYLITSQW